MATDFTMVGKMRNIQKRLEIIDKKLDKILAIQELRYSSVKDLKTMDFLGDIKIIKGKKCKLVSELGWIDTKTGKVIQKELKMI